ncbi:MAG: hypothetical protein R2765_10140 [Ferruginibacter sp.]
MDNILLSATLAFLITFFAIPVIIQVAKDKKLFDEPDERKVHKNVIPTLGGLGIFAGLYYSNTNGCAFRDHFRTSIFLPQQLLRFLLGIKDDILIFIGQ